MLKRAGHRGTRSADFSAEHPAGHDAEHPLPGHGALHGRKVLVDVMS
jgi:hypothetical protein